MFGGGGGGNSNEQPMNPDAGGYGYGPPGSGPPGPNDQEMGNAQNPPASSSYGQQPPAYTQTPAYGHGGQPGNFSNSAPQAPYPDTQPGQPAYAKMTSTPPTNVLWFSAACSVMFGATISFFSELFSLEWVDALQMSYLFVFGLLMAALDTPVFTQVTIVSEMRAGISKYIAILNRVTGKGAAYVFLGSALWSSMFANVEGGFLLFLAVLIGVFVVFTGCFSLAIAVLKSRNLNLVRLELRKEPMSLKQMYDMHAKMNPTNGITQEEFKKMTPYARGVSFDQADIKLIFNALSSNPRKDVISLEDLTGWVNGNMMVFI